MTTPQTNEEIPSWIKKFNRIVSEAGGDMCRSSYARPFVRLMQNIYDTKEKERDEAVQKAREETINQFENLADQYESQDILDAVSEIRSLKTPTK